jgi:hypothetical protein
MNKINLIVILLVVSFSYSGCKKEAKEPQKEAKEPPFQSNFTINGSVPCFYTPVAYVKVEGTSPNNIYWLSLTFPTGGVTFENGSFIGYGNAVQVFFYTNSLAEIPVGTYPYVTTITSSDLFFKLTTIRTFSDNYAFSYQKYQTGTLLTNAKNGQLTVSKTGDIYDISYRATMTKKQVIGTYLDSWWLGNYKGKIVFPK